MEHDNPTGRMQMPPHPQHLLRQSSCVPWEPEEELSHCHAEHPSSGHASSAQGTFQRVSSCHCLMQQELSLLPAGLGALDLFSRCGIKSLPRSVGRAGKNLGAEGPLELFGLILAGQRHRTAEAFLSCSWENSALSPRCCPCALCRAPSAPCNPAWLEAVLRGCAGWAQRVGRWGGQVLVLSALS